MPPGHRPHDRPLVEPPRDGEFFFEEGWADEYAAPGALESLFSILMRHRALSLGSALGVVLIVTSLVLGF